MWDFDAPKMTFAQNDNDKPGDINQNEVGAKEQTVDLDKILVEEIGEFGWYQCRAVIMCALYIICGAITSSEYVFSTARISTRCLIPECEGREPEFAPTWILNAVPDTGVNNFESCERYTNVTSVFNQTCPASFFNQSNRRSCDEYVYKYNDTVVYEFDLACKEWQRTMIGSIRTIGNLLVLPLAGYVSDRWGRRTAMAINSFNAAVIGISKYWANGYWTYMILNFLESTLGSGGFACVYILMLELMGPKYRVIGGAIITMSFSIGQGLTGLISWALPYWRHLTLAAYTPQFLCISYFWLMAESVRWLMSKGCYEKSEEILIKAAKINGNELSEKSLEALRRTNEGAKKRQELDKLNGIKEPWLPSKVWNCKPMLLRCMVTPIFWVTMTLVYYGLSINAVNLSGNKYVNYVAVSAIEIPGYWVAVALLNRVGRKPVLIAGYWICAACMIGFILLPRHYATASLTLYLIGKCSNAMVAASIYIYTSEVYPTKYRHRLLAFSSMIGRLGSMIAPLTPALGKIWVEFPFALFAGFCLLSGLLMFTCPETLGSMLPDTLEEAAVLRKKNNTSAS